MLVLALECLRWHLGLQCTGTGAAGAVNLQKVLHKGVRTVTVNDTEHKRLFGTPEKYQ